MRPSTLLMTLLGPAAAPSLLLLVLAGPTLAQRATLSAGTADDSASARRILHLAGGTTLRCLARATDGGVWEIKEGGGWHALPDGAVVRAVLEKDARAELRQRERDTAEEPGPRAELADWALVNGLLEEGLTELEALLAADPDQPAARATLARHAHRFSVPEVDPRSADADEATAELRRWAAARSATSRELALVELARLRDREGLEQVLAADLFASTPGRRTFATLALQRLMPGHATKPLLHRAVTDPSDGVRAGAARALRDGGEVGVIVPVAKALESSHPKVRTFAAETLGNLGYPAAVEPLMVRLAALQDTARHSVPHSHIFVGRQFAYIQDFDVEVAQFQAVADPSVNVLIEGEVLDAGVRSIADKYFVSESRAIRTSLQQLTGASPGRTNRAWLDWWDENGPRWRASALADRPPVTPGR